MRTSRPEWFEQTGRFVAASAMALPTRRAAEAFSSGRTYGSPTTRTPDKVVVTIHGQTRMRISPSVYNNNADVDALLNTLS